MKQLPIALVLLSLVSCGGGGSSKPNEEKFVKGLNCLQTPSAPCIPKTRWNINTKEDGFPLKMKIILNGGVLFDQCGRHADIEVSTIGPDAFNIDRVTKSFLVQGALNKKQLMKLVIIDRGEDCRNDAIFFSSDEVAIEPLDHAEANDWFVSQKVSLTLDN